MKKMKTVLAALFALCIMLTACGDGNSEITAETTAGETEVTLDWGEEETIYTGKTVENEEDLAIYKFNCEIPEGYEVVVDSSEGKVFSSPNGSITVKAQNYKEEFQSLEVFADQACAGILLSNTLHQADTNFDEPVETKVNGFDAIRYDYTVTAYIYTYATDSDGNYIVDDDGNPEVESKDIYGEYVNRVYYFYSDEDVFYFICEAPKDCAEQAAADFDSFVESVTITPPSES